MEHGRRILSVCEKTQRKQDKSLVTSVPSNTALLFDCVMRRGELLGLRFQDIDFENKTISIRHSLVESVDSKCPVLKDCKTDGSNRTMVVSDYTMKLLKQQKYRYNTNRMKYGKDFGNSNMVISKEDGNYFLPKESIPGMYWSRKANPG